MNLFKYFSILAGLGTFLITVFLALALVAGNLAGNDKAVFTMALILILLWIGVFGGLSFLFRDKIKSWVISLPGCWQNKFLLFAVGLALVEEAIAVTLTNLAGYFGGVEGEAFITASANYFEVIFFASVIVFIPMFWLWTKLLEKYNFKPYEVMVLFGLTGWLAEVVAFDGSYNLLLIFWIFVYGLMVYLPAYSLPERKGTRRPPRVVYFEAVILPILVAIPVIILISILKAVFDIEMFV